MLNAEIEADNQKRQAAKKPYTAKPEPEVFGGNGKRGHDTAREVFEVECSKKELPGNPYSQLPLSVMALPQGSGLWSGTWEKECPTSLPWL